MRRRTAVLISGSGSNLQALIDASRADDYPAEITLVISNKPDAYGLTRAKQAGIPAEVISHKDYSNRAAFDDAMDRRLRASDIEIVCLAGFMRLLTPAFVKSWHDRMLNIHPSLLPDFKGGHAVRDALAAGIKETGCTVHFVTEEMDAGPVLMQARVSVESGDTEETLLTRIHAQEHLLYPQALKKLAEKL
jgi:phosphoribosylglycinamide formyltransferase-1